MVNPYSRTGGGQFGKKPNFITAAGSSPRSSGKVSMMDTVFGEATRQSRVPLLGGGGGGEPPALFRPLAGSSSGDEGGGGGGNGRGNSETLAQMIINQAEIVINNASFLGLEIPGGGGEDEEEDEEEKPEYKGALGFFHDIMAKIAPKLGMSGKAFESLFDSSVKLGGAKGLGMLTKGMGAAGLKAMALAAGMKFLEGVFAPFSSIMDTIGILGEALGTGFYPIVNDINAALLELLPYMMMAAQWISTAYEALKSWMAGMTVETFVAWLSDTTVAIAQWFGALPGNIGRWFSENQGALVAFFSNLPSVVGTWIAGALVQIGTWFMYTAVPTIIGWLLNGTLALAGWFLSWGGLIIQWIGAGLQVLGNWMGGLPGMFVTWLGEGIGVIGTYLNSLGSTIVNTIMSNFNYITSWASTVPKQMVDAFKSGADAAWKEVTDWAANIDWTFWD